MVSFTYSLYLLLFSAQYIVASSSQLSGNRRIKYLRVVSMKTSSIMNGQLVKRKWPKLKEGSKQVSWRGTHAVRNTHCSSLVPSRRRHTVESIMHSCTHRQIRRRTARLRSQLRNPWASRLARPVLVSTRLVHCITARLIRQREDTWHSSCRRASLLCGRVTVQLGLLPADIQIYIVIPTHS